LSDDVTSSMSGLCIEANSGGEKERKIERKPNQYNGTVRI